MKKLIYILSFSVLLTPAFAQNKKSVTAYLSFQYTQTLYDATTGNNPWAAGASSQVLFNSQKKYRPMVELSFDQYFANDKVLRLSENDIPVNEINNVSHLFGGMSAQVVEPVFVSFLAGPSLIDRRILFGIKPALGIYLSKAQRTTVTLSYTHICNREQLSGKDFGSASLAFGFRLF